MTGDFSLIIGERTTPSFVAVFFDRRRRSASFFWIRFKLVDAVFDYTILPEITLSSLAQLSVLEASEEAAILIYRKLADYSNFYSRALMLDRLSLSSERVVATDQPLLTGSNERLVCKPSPAQAQAECVMIVEGNRFAEFTFDYMEVTEADSALLSRRRGVGQTGKVRDIILKVNSSSVYNHYLNSVCEQVDFSDQFIVLQTLTPSSSFYSADRRFMLVYRRGESHPDLYRGVLCQVYSTSCVRPVNVIVGPSGRDFYLSADNDNNLVLNFTFKERRFMLPPKTSFSSDSIGEYYLRITNVFNPTNYSSAPLNAIINFSDSDDPISTEFSWVGAVLTLVPPWLLVLFALFREHTSSKKLKKAQTEPQYDRATILKNINLQRQADAEGSQTQQTLGNISLMDKTKPRDDLREDEEDRETQEIGLRPRHATYLDSMSDA